MILQFLLVAAENQNIINGCKYAKKNGIFIVTFSVSKTIIKMGILIFGKFKKYNHVENVIKFGSIDYRFDKDNNIKKKINIFY